jgi:hypothetical protein
VRAARLYEVSGATTPRVASNAALWWQSTDRAIDSDDLLGIVDVR